MKKIILIALICVMTVFNISAKDFYSSKENNNTYWVVESDDIYGHTSGKRVFEAPTYKSKGYRGYAEIGASIGLSHDFTFFNVRTTHGYQFSQNLFLGGGVGIDIPTDEGNKTIMMPVYGAIRIQTNHHAFTPFIDYKMGYNINTDEVEYGAFYMHPSIGVNMAVGNNIGLNVSVGASFNRYSYESDYYGNETITLSAISVSIGIEF